MAATQLNAVSQSPVLPGGTPMIFDDWLRIPPGLRSLGMWHGEGRGIKKNQKPMAYFDPDSLGGPRRLIGLYERPQTYELTEPTRSKRMLIRMFVRRNELFGLRPVGADRPIHRHTNFLRGSVSDLVYRSFDYKHRGRGTRTGFRFEKKPVFADAFYVLAPEYTDWFVIDIDNHWPTVGATMAHLRLVRHLIGRIPEISRGMGATSVFYDYKQDSPRGIHIWFKLARKSAVKPLHHKVRGLLRRLADPAIDRRLREHGLRPMGSLEILPTEGQLIRMFGGWDRRVFTTEELQPKNEMFDAQSLLRHIKTCTIKGNPYERYSSLAMAGLGNADDEAPSAIPVKPAILLLSSSAPSRGAGYIGRIVEACLNGVTESDMLYEAYLAPLAQALFWREFHDKPDRVRLTGEALLRWIDTKHNGMITRINEDKRNLVVEQVRHVVKKLPFTPVGIRNYWEKVVANDRAFPRQKISFVDCMDAVLKKPVLVSGNVLKQLPSLLAGGGVIHAKGNTYNVCCDPTSSSSLPSLPPLVAARLHDHLRSAGVRTGKVQERFILFALNLLNEIGVSGTRTIDGGRMNLLADLGQGRNHIRRYKKLLLGAGIIEPGWKNTYSKAKKLAARYDLTPWALVDLRRHWENHFPQPPDPSRSMGEKPVTLLPASDREPALRVPENIMPDARKKPVDLSWQENEYRKCCEIMKNGKTLPEKSWG